MKLPKKAGLFLGIAFLFFLFLVIFGNYQGTVTNSNKSKSEIINEKTDSEPKLKITKKITRTSNDSVLLLETEKKISKEIVGSLIKLNPDGPARQIAGDKQQMLKALNPKKIADEIIKKELAKIKDINLGLDSVAVKKIKVSPLSTADATEKYFQAFQKILSDNFAKKTNDFNLLTTAYQKAIDEFYQLRTPINLINIHKKEILLLSQQALLLTKLKDAELNPLEALAALQRNEELGSQFNDLKDDILAVLR